MLTEEQNERLTHVGPGTPMGELMRRYWHPVAVNVDLAERPTKRVRILGEDLVLYRDTSGGLGLIGPRCAHRGVDLVYGMPEPNGLRCPYHGWLYDATGQCLEQPAEPEGSTYYKQFRLPSYPVQELGGLIFAYLGPSPVPLLPRWDLLVWDNVDRETYGTVLPCNWLQCQENSLDPVHNEWLHGYYGIWFVEQTQPGKTTGTLKNQRRHHRRIGFDAFEHGIIKRRLYDGMDDDDENWRIGHPVVFPNILRHGRGNGSSTQLNYRVPIDDTHTWNLHYVARPAGPGEVVPAQEVLQYTELPLYGDDGLIRRESIGEQDNMVFAAQGPISNRPTEGLATTDKGIVMFRRMLQEQLTIVEDGGDPLNVFRDPAQNRCIVLPQEHTHYPGESETGGPFKHLESRPAQVEADLSRTRAEAGPAR